MPIARLASILLLVSPSLHAADPIRVQTDVPYLEPDRTEKLDLYLPAPRAKDADMAPVLASGNVSSLSFS